jgi:hypothetical protein
MKTGIILATLALIIIGSLFFTLRVSDRSAEVERLLGPSPAALPAEASPTAGASVNSSAKKSTTAGQQDPLAIRLMLESLADLPAGDEAIALGQRIENAITPGNTSAFADALLTTDHAAVERTAMGALSRSADSRTISELVQRYGSTPEDRRGRILQVLENAANPAATDGLIQVVQTDTSEKRSPLLTSAMNGLAGLGTTDAVSFLIRQVATDNETFALMALERVSSEQGREILRAAADGNKDSEGIPPELLAALERIAAK